MKKQIILKGPAVSTLFGFGLECVGNRGAGPKRRVLRNPDRERDLIRRRKPDAPDVTAEPIGVCLHDGDGVGTVLANDLRHLDDRDAVSLPEDHVFAHRLVLMPALADLTNLRSPELRHFMETSRLVREDHHRLLSERVDNTLREDRPDTLDQTGCQVLLNAFQ